VCTIDPGWLPSLGGNLFSDSSCKPEIDDRIFSYASMRLGRVAVYGGWVPTIPLMPGSPAIDYGIGGNCTTADGAPLAIDQRFEERQDGLCDVGSYERQAHDAPSLVFLPLVQR
jgi:hypothetical protein